MAARGCLSLRAYNIACTTNAEKDLFSIRTDLRVFDSARLEQDEIADIVSLGEETFVAGKRSLYRRCSNVSAGGLWQPRKRQ